jgi:uncharacterized membrane protein
LPSATASNLESTSSKEPLQHRLHGAFGEDAFGHYAENAARFFGTPQYIVGQTIVVIIWIALNATGLSAKLSG